MSIFYLPRSQGFDTNGLLMSGAKLNFYEVGTSTRRNTYSDRTLSTANTNPVVANSAGLFGPIYLLSGGYKVVLTDSDDVELWSQDNIYVNSSYGENTLTQTADRGYSLVRGSQNHSIYIEDSDSSLRFLDILNSLNYFRYTPGAGFYLNNGGVDISPSGTTGIGTLALSGNGYGGYITLDGTAMYVGHTSASRDLRLQTDETDRLTISGTGAVAITGTSLQLGTVTWTTGAGSPEGVVTAVVGSLYSRTDGSTSTTLYVKTSGSGNTGWTAK